MVCLAAGLFSTWDAVPAQAGEYTFSGEITPTSNLTNVYFLFAVGSFSPGGGVFAQQIADFAPANATTPFTISFNSIPDGLGTGEGCTVVALSDTWDGSVALGYDPTQAADVTAIIPAPMWDGYWLPASNGSLYYRFFVYESDVAAALLSDLATGAPFSPVGAPFPEVSTDPSNPSTFTLVDFCRASYGGSGFVVEVVPEPASFSILAAGLILYSFGRYFRPRTKD